MKITGNVNIREGGEELLTDGKAVNPITHPDLKRAQLRGPDLEKFRKQVNQSLAERDREAKAIVSVAD